MIQVLLRRIGTVALLGCILSATGCQTYYKYCPSCLHCHSHSVPETLPLGSVVRAHYHEMETNGEAVDFIIYRNEFAGQTACLTPDGRDHVLEIAARFRETPFPIVIERSENNMNPPLDAARRDRILQILCELGHPEADSRTFVAPAYGISRNSREAEIDFYRHHFSRGNNGFGAGNGFGGSGGFGGAGGFGGFGGAGF